MPSLKLDAGGAAFGRAALTVLLCLLTGLRMHYRRRAGLYGPDALPFAEGPFLVGCRIAFGLPVAAATVASVFLPDRAAPLLVALPLAVRIAGAAGALASLALLARVQRALGRSFSTTVFLRPGHHLVTDGPYRLVRHPMYSAYVAFFLSLFAVSGNWLLSASGLGMILVLMTVRLRREEAILLGRYGERYRRYRERTGAFVPRRCAFRSAGARRSVPRPGSSSPCPAAAPRRRRAGPPEGEARCP